MPTVQTKPAPRCALPERPIYTGDMDPQPPSAVPLTNSPPSPVERIKAGSRHLRGRIAEELAEPTEHFSEETAQVLKHHGMYQQDDRDRRQHLGVPGGKPQKVWSLMVRTS